EKVHGEVERTGVEEHVGEERPRPRYRGERREPKGRFEPRVHEDRQLEQKDDQIGDDQPSHPRRHAEHPLRAHRLLIPRARSLSSRPGGRSARTAPESRFPPPGRPAGGGWFASFPAVCSPPNKRCPPPGSTGSRRANTLRVSTPGALRAPAPEAAVSAPCPALRGKSPPTYRGYTCIRNRRARASE